MVVSHTPKVGQFAKRQSREIFMREFMIAFVAAVAAAFLAGLGVGLLFSGVAAAGFVALAMLTTSVLGWVGVRIIERRMDKFSKRRLALLRGGQAEAYVSLLLRDNLDEEWHLFDNLSSMPTATSITCSSGRAGCS